MKDAYSTRSNEDVARYIGQHPWLVITAIIAIAAFCIGSLLVLMYQSTSYESLEAAANAYTANSSPENANDLYDKYNVCVNQISLFVSDCDDQWRHGSVYKKLLAEKFVSLKNDIGIVTIFLTRDYSDNAILPEIRKYISSYQGGLPELLIRKGFINIEDKKMLTSYTSFVTVFK